MNIVHRYVAIGALILAALPSAAITADVINWNGCTVPIFGADKRAPIAACTALLNRDGLRDADRERALLVRGRAYHRNDDVDAAIRDFDAAIKVAPQDPEPLLRRASAAFSQEDYDAATGLAERALRLDAKNANAYDTLGTVALVKRNYRMAKAQYDRAIELDPGSVESRFHRFAVFMKVGAQREAMRELDDLLALNSADLDRESTDFHGKEVPYRIMVRLERATNRNCPASRSVIRARA